MVDVASAGPVGAGLDCDAHVLDPSILRAHLRLVQRSRILAVESVQTPFHEVLLIGARHEWESAAYKNQFDFVDRVAHSSELSKSTLNLGIRDSEISLRIWEFAGTNGDLYFLQTSIFSLLTSSLEGFSRLNSLSRISLETCPATPLIFSR